MHHRQQEEEEGVNDKFSQPSLSTPHHGTLTAQQKREWQQKQSTLRRQVARYYKRNHSSGQQHEERVNQQLGLVSFDKQAIPVACLPSYAETTGQYLTFWLGKTIVFTPRKYCTLTGKVPRKSRSATTSCRYCDKPIHSSAADSIPSASSTNTIYNPLPKQLCAGCYERLYENPDGFKAGVCVWCGGLKLIKYHEDGETDTTCANFSSCLREWPLASETWTDRRKRRKEEKKKKQQQQQEEEKAEEESVVSIETKPKPRRKKRKRCTDDDEEEKKERDAEVTISVIATTITTPTPTPPPPPPSSSSSKPLLRVRIKLGRPGSIPASVERVTVDPLMASLSSLDYISPRTIKTTATATTKSERANMLLPPNAKRVKLNPVPMSRSQFVKWLKRQ